MTLLLASRRRLFGLGAAFLAAPSIVRVSSLMPVSVLEPTVDLSHAWVPLDVLYGWKTIDPSLCVRIANSPLSPNVVDFMERIAEPALRALAAKIE